MEITGVFAFNDKKYPFLLDGRKVYLVGEPFEYVNDFRNVETVDTITGVTSTNRDILFLKCEFPELFISSQYCFYIQGYAISNNNVGIKCDFNYDAIAFTADAINAFYPPQKALKYDVEFQNWDGSMDIHITPFTDTTLNFDYLDARCELSISRNIKIFKKPTSIGEVNSIFKFLHSKKQAPIKIIDDYLAIYDFLSFVTYNKNINFNEIYLQIKREDGFYDKIATVHFFRNEALDEGSLDSKITFYDMPQNKIGDIFACVASLRKNNSRLRYYFPKSKHEGRYIDPGRWLMMSINFEGLFALAYPDFKSNNKPAFKNAKKIILERIDNCSDGKIFSKEENKYYENCRKQIENYEGILEEKFNYVFNENKNTLRRILEFNEKEFGMSETANYGAIYSSYRNKISHGSVEPLTDREVAIYRVLLPMMYILILKDANLLEEELTKIVSKLYS